MEVTHELILGPFRSGKTTELLRRIQRATNPLILSPLQMHANELRRAGIAVHVPNDMTVKQLIQSRPNGIFIDDADRLSPAHYAILMAGANEQGLVVVATSRKMLPGFSIIHKESRSHGLSTSTQRFLATLYGLCDVTIKPNPGLALVAIPTVTSVRTAMDALLSLHAHLSEGAVVLGVPPQLLVSKIQERYPNVVIYTPTEFYGCSAANIIVYCSRLLTDALLDAMTRSTQRLVIAFDAAAPPEVLAHCRRNLEPLFNRQQPFINWENFVCDRSLNIGTRTHAAPRTVLGKVRHLAEELKERDEDVSTTAALKYAAQSLGWGQVPSCKFHSDRGAKTVFEGAGALTGEQRRVSGLATEALLGRAISFVEPETPVIAPPEAALRVINAAFTTSDQFLRAWSRAGTLRRSTQDEQGWLVAFSNADLWGPDARNMARRLANHRDPLVLPDSLRPAIPHVEEAVGHYCNHDLWVLSEKSAWVIGSACFIAQPGTTQFDALRNAIAMPPTNDDCKARPMRRIQQRLLHFLSTGGVQRISEQVSVAAPGIRGVCDFTINDTTVLELKCSNKPHNSFACQVEWPLQAAMYAHALKYRRAVVYNVNREVTCTIEFNPNLFL